MGAQSSVPWPEGAPNAKDMSCKLSRNLTERPDDSKLFELGILDFGDEVLDTVVPPDPVSMLVILRPAADGEPNAPAFCVTKVGVMIKEDNRPKKGYGKTFLRIRRADDVEGTDPLFQSTLSKESTRLMESFTHGLYDHDSACWPLEDARSPLRVELWGRQGLVSAAEVPFSALVSQALDKSPKPDTWEDVHIRLTRGSAYPYTVTGATFASLPDSAVKVEFEVYVSMYGLPGLGINVRREGLEKRLKKRTEERELAAQESARSTDLAKKTQSNARAAEAVKVQLPIALQAVTSLGQALTLKLLLSEAWREACRRGKNWPGTDTAAGVLLHPHSAALLRLCAMCAGHAPSDAAAGSAFAFVWVTLVAWHAAVNLTCYAGFGEALLVFFPWATVHDSATAHAFYESVQQSIAKWGSLPEHLLQAKLGGATATERTALPPGASEWLGSFTWPPGPIYEQASEALEFSNSMKPAERFRKMAPIFEGRAPRWAAAHSSALVALVAYGAAEAKNHMDTQRSLFDMTGRYDATREFWEAVARFVLQLAHARQGHLEACAPLLDPCFQSPEANILVDGIGVHHRSIPLSRDDFTTIHKMYYWRVPQPDGPTNGLTGPWYFSGFKDWTSGGWIHAVR